MYAIRINETKEEERRRKKQKIVNNQKRKTTTITTTRIPIARKEINKARIEVATCEGILTNSLLYDICV
jgi:hypothetical protein